MTSQDMQPALFDDLPELNTSLADLVPTANRIADAAAKYISTVHRMFTNPKVKLYVGDESTLADTLQAAKLAVKAADSINARLREHDERYTLSVTLPKKNAQDMRDVPLVDENGEIVA